MVAFAETERPTLNVALPQVHSSYFKDFIATL
jgi:hypothetical protein